MNKLWKWLSYQLWCLPVTLWQDLPIKLQNLWQQLFLFWRGDQKSPVLGFDPPRGSRRMVFFCPGYNQTPENMQREATLFAQQLGAGLRFLRLSGSGGNLLTILTAFEQNRNMLAGLRVREYKITFIGYSLGGCIALALAYNMVQLWGRPPASVICIASPLQGSCLARLNVTILRRLTWLGRWIPFFKALQVAQDMVPGSDACCATAKMAQELKEAGVPIFFFRFDRDGLVQPHQAAPYDFHPAEKVPGSMGHTSITRIDIIDWICGRSIELERSIQLARSIQQSDQEAV